jgi:hypothetical protein
MTTSDPSFLEDLIVVSDQSPVITEEVTDPSELAKAQARRERFDRNWVWFNAHAAEVYRTHRGKCICISGQELFVADTPAEVLALAKAAHPDDDGRFTGIIPKERLARIYAHQRRVATVR